MKKWKSGKVILADESLRERIKGKTIALMMNGTAIHNDGRLLMDVIIEEKWATVAFFFGMEHGVRCNFSAGDKDHANVDEKTGIPIVNLYDFPNRRPPVEYLKSVDAVVFCAQDSGVRHWTFTPWMIMLLDSAAKANCEVIIVDRPNPIRGDIVEGNCVEKKYCGTLLTGYGYPLRHGMTIGELAIMYNAENNLGLKLSVLKMDGWTRNMWYDETGLLWLPPTANIPTPDTFLHFATTGLLQGSNMSFGRKTTTPFQFIGLPEFSSEALATELNSRGLSDVFFAPKFYMATTLVDDTKLLPCNGIMTVIADRNTYRAAKTQLHLFDAISMLYYDIVNFEFQKFWARKRMGTDDIYNLLERRESVLSLIDKWELESNQFNIRREKYLLY